MATVSKNVPVKDFIGLSEELNLFLTEKVTLGVKQSVSVIKKQLEDALNAANTLQLNLIKKYGGTEVKPGTWKIEQIVVEKGETPEEDKIVPNPKHASYKKEYEALLAKTQAIFYTPINFEDIKHLVTENNYEKLYFFVDGLN